MKFYNPGVLTALKWYFTTSQHNYMAGSKFDVQVERERQNLWFAHGLCSGRNVGKLTKPKLCIKCAEKNTATKALFLLFMYSDFL